MKSSKLKSIKLFDRWTDEYAKAFGNEKALIVNSFILAHSKEDQLTFLFTDVSELHWTLVLNQISPEDVAKSVKIQHHKPLAFICGSFAESQLHWSVIEKKTYPMIHAFHRRGESFGKCPGSTENE